MVGSGFFAFAQKKSGKHVKKGKKNVTIEEMITAAVDNRIEEKLKALGVIEEEDPVVEETYVDDDGNVVNPEEK